MQNKRFITDLSAVILLGGTLLAVSAANLFQPDRATVSESEQRKLAEFPAFSWSALADGSYFSGISDFFTDTFPAREKLVMLAGKVETLYGAILTDSEKDIAVLNAAVTPQTTVEITLPELTVPQVTERQTEPPVEETIVIETESAPAETTQPEDTLPPLENLAISSLSMTITEGQSAYLSASVEPIERTDVRISWTNSDSGVIKLGTEGSKLVLTALKAGRAEITASCEGMTAVCVVTVNPVPQQGGSTQIITGEPEFLTNGMIFYGDAVYSIPYYVDYNAKSYGKAVEYLAQLFPNSRITSLIAPLSSVMLDRSLFGNRLTDQRQIIESVNSHLGENINALNIHDRLLAHKGEYLYYKTDHHWTALGAYYAYCDFAESVGFEAAPLDKWEKITLTEDFHGSMNAYTNNDERVAKISDTVDAYMPFHEHTMTIYGGYLEGQYDNCIYTGYHNYSAFIRGDNPYTVINVPANPQDCNILVFKDSYGNALIPYLTAHYGNIIVVDPRHVTFNVYELLKDYPLRDVLWATNIYNPNTAGFTLNVLRSVGVE